MDLKLGVATAFITNSVYVYMHVLHPIRPIRPVLDVRYSH